MSVVSKVYGKVVVQRIRQGTEVISKVGLEERGNV